jgi:hypothetical protein
MLDSLVESVDIGQSSAVLNISSNSYTILDLAEVYIRQKTWHISFRHKHLRLNRNCIPDRVEIYLSSQTFILDQNFIPSGTFSVFIRRLWCKTLGDISLLMWIFESVAETFWGCRFVVNFLSLKTFFLCFRLWMLLTVIKRNFLYIFRVVSSRFLDT